MISEKDRERLRSIKTFPSLVKYLRDELDWPIETNDFDDSIYYEYNPEELGIDAKNAAKILEIKQLRPLANGQPWGVFFVRFEPRRLPVVVLRRILSQLVIKTRATSRSANQKVWHLNDLLFISNYCEDDERKITFAHFTQNEDTGDLPTLKVLGWDEGDTALHLDDVHQRLKDQLRWPKDDLNSDEWRKQWSSAFTLRHREVIATSKDLAVHLADLAKKIRNRALQIIAIESDKGELRKLHQAFREALIHDLNEDDFADMYAQTIAYGLLAARVSRPMGITADNMADMVPITNPFLKEMLSVFLTVGGRKSGIDFDELGVQDVVELLNRTNMEAVLRDFGNRTQREDPVIHFYQDFLQEYDRQIRVERGVFYTPQPVVSYIVRSVHELLQKEFGLEEGLASTITWGEMIKKNEDLKLPILKPRDPDNLESKDIQISPNEPFVTILDPATGTATFLVEVIDIIHKTMITKWERLGLKQPKISLKWNEYVPAHLLPRLIGFELMMAPYAIAHMKIGLKLHETGYKFGSGERVRVYLTNSLEPASDSVQKDLNHYSEALAHEAISVNNVKLNKRFSVIIGNPPYSVSSQNDNPWIIDLCKDFKQGLRNEKNIQPLSDDYIKFLRLALHYLEQNKVGLLGMITNREYIKGVLHRCIRQKFLESVNNIDIFDLHGQRGELLISKQIDKPIFKIEKGVAISIMTKFHPGSSIVNYSECIGSVDEKEKILLNFSSQTIHKNLLQPLFPNWLFKPWNSDFKDEYFSMPSIVDFFSKRPVTGFATHRDHFAIKFSKPDLRDNLKNFLNADISDEKIRSDFQLKDTRDWQLKSARRSARGDNAIQNRIQLCSYRPFDNRWVIYSDDILEYSRRDAMQHISKDTPALICSRIVKDEDYAHVFISHYPVEKIFLSPKSSNNSQICLSGTKIKTIKSQISNFNLLVIPKQWVNKGIIGEDNVFLYVYTILHSPTYRIRYSEFLKNDFPRVPIPNTLDLFNDLIPLGTELVAIHLMESPKINKTITKYLGTTPSGEVEKISYSDNTVWIDKAQTIGFRGVPENVWNFHIGGYQVCDKWLKDRKGLQLSTEDITHYQKIVVALNETIRIMGEIDAVIDKHGGWPGAFDTSGRCIDTGTGNPIQQTLFSGGEGQE